MVARGGWLVTPLDATLSVAAARPARPAAGPLRPRASPRARRARRSWPSSAPASRPASAVTSPRGSRPASPIVGVAVVSGLADRHRRDRAMPRRSTPAAPRSGSPGAAWTGPRRGRNDGLARRILAHGGAIVGELAPGVLPTRGHVPAPQPHHQRARERDDRRRGAGPLGRAHHRPPRARAGEATVRRPGPAARPVRSRMPRAPAGQPGPTGGRARRAGRGPRARSALLRPASRSTRRPPSSGSRRSSVTSRGRWATGRRHRTGSSSGPGAGPGRSRPRSRSSSCAASRGSTGRSCSRPGRSWRATRADAA